MYVLYAYLLCIGRGIGMVGLSVGEKHFIQGGIAQDLRTDGRKRLTYRPIIVEAGVIAQVNPFLFVFSSLKFSSFYPYGSLIIKKKDLLFCAY